MVVSLDKPYNQTSEDLIVKFCLNIPVQDFIKVAQLTKKGTIYNGRKAPWLRQAIVEKLAKTKIREKPITLKQMLQFEREGKITEPLKRYPGFWRSLVHPFKLRHIRRKYLTNR